MFGKKILSIVGLLFLGIQFTSVKAIGIQTCSEASVNVNACSSLTGEPTGVCIDGNTVYFYNDDNGSCAIKSTYSEGIHVLEQSFTELELSDVENGTKNYLLYVCDDSNCALTNGFVKGKDEAYIQITSGQAEATNASGDLVGSDKASCTAGSLFMDEDDSKIKICITPGKGVELATNGETKNFIVQKTGPLTEDNNNLITDMVVQVSDKAFVLNTLYTDKEYCAYESHEIQDRITNFCSGTILDDMYSCTEGLCKKSASPIAAGEYIVKGTTGDFKLYKCVDGTTGTVNCEVDVDADDNGILLVKEESNDKEYTFQKVYSSSELSNANLDEEDYYIYDCVGGACKPAEALIRFSAGGVVTTAHCVKGAKCAAGTEIIYLEKIGIISYASNFIMTPTGESAVALSSGGTYAFAGGESAFAVIKNVGGVIVAKAEILEETYYVKIDDNTVVTKSEYDLCQSTIKQYTSVNAVTSTATPGDNCVPPEIECELDTETPASNIHCGEGYYLKSTGTNVGLAKENNESGTLYHCSGSGKACIEVSAGFKPGFYKNVDVVNNETVQYIKCPALGTCTAVAVTASSCSNAKIGGLIVKGVVFSICIDTSDEHAVELTDDNATAGVKVFISIDTESDAGADAFGEQVKDNYVLLDIGVNCLKNDSDKLNYRYTGQDQILVKRNDQNKESICVSPGNIKEFKKGANNLYTKTH